LIPHLSHQAQDLQGRQVGGLLQNPDHLFPKFCTVPGLPICRFFPSASSSTCSSGSSCAIRCTERNETPLMRALRSSGGPPSVKLRPRVV
jgi:hypothetical protein